MWYKLSKQLAKKKQHNLTPHPTHILYDNDINHIIGTFKQDWQGKNSSIIDVSFKHGFFMWVWQQQKKETIQAIKIKKKEVKKNKRKKGKL